MRNQKQKVFGIGLSRTGTLSLTNALQMLGYNAVHWPRSASVIPSYDAATDITTSMRFKLLDVAFPGSKFIYTIRDKESWLDSCERWWNQEVIKIQLQEFAAGNSAYYWVLALMEAEMAMYGAWKFDKDLWSAGYDRHDDNVRNYFKDRDSSLLVMDICSGDGWEKLTQFIPAYCDDVEAVIQQPFPRMHVWQDLYPQAVTTTE